LQVGDLVRYSDSMAGLHGIIGVVVEKYDSSALVQWANHPGGPNKSLSEEPDSFIEIYEL
jgi:hypothetical protein